MFLKLPLNISIAVQNYAHFLQNISYTTQKRMEEEIQGYLRKEEKDFFFFSAIPKKRRIKFGARKILKIYVKPNCNFKILFYPDEQSDIGRML